MKKLVIFTIISLLSLSLFAKSKGYMLRDDGPLRVDNGQGGAEWDITVPAGTELELESEETVKMTLITKDKNYPDTLFYKVKYEGKTYYVRDVDFAVGTQLSVILDDTVLFTKPRLSSFVNAVLERGTLVVVGKAEKTPDSLGMTEIKYFSSSAGVIRTRYVFTDDISTNKSDVKAIMICDKVQAISNSDKAKEKAMKMELFNNAQKLDTSYQISSYVNELYEKVVDGE